MFVHIWLQSLLHLAYTLGYTSSSHPITLYVQVALQKYDTSYNIS